jgi:UDP-GlcNAc3NAcA epimerase
MTNRPRIVTVVGARPQFVKAAVVSRAFAEAGLDECLIHTGQHYDAAMSDIFFDELGIAPPAHNLGVGSGPHGKQTAAMLAGIESVLLERKPAMLVIYGDTNSTVAGALAAAKLHVPIAHIEAGLRSFLRAMPEEINRVVADHLSDWLFCPTDTAVENLRAEGIVDGMQRGPGTVRVLQVGDVMLDATRTFAPIALAKSSVLADLGVRGKPYVLATVHRAENTDRPECLGEIIAGLEALAARMPVILPLHPRTRGRLADNGLVPKRIRIIEPVGYLDMNALEAGAALIATDSGGVQKEAFFHGVPCVTLRDRTEWTELVTHGWNRLADPAVPGEVLRTLAAAIEAPRPSVAASLYGEGDASRRIASAVAQAVGKAVGAGAADFAKIP